MTLRGIVAANKEPSPEKKALIRAALIKITVEDMKKAPAFYRNILQQSEYWTEKTYEIVTHSSDFSDQASDDEIIKAVREAVELFLDEPQTGVKDA
jgi:hypothetical protein